MKNTSNTITAGCAQRGHQKGGQAASKRIGFGIVLTLALLLIPTMTASAQGALSVNVNSINGFAIQMPPAMVISSATPGEDPDPITATSTWGFTSNGNTNRTLVASLDNQPPQGLSITIDLGTPVDSDASGTGASVGSASLGTFDNTTFEDVTLWSGARRSRASGNVTWTAVATTELGEDDDYAGNLLLTFE